MPLVVNKNGNIYWPNNACEKGHKKVWYHTAKFALSWSEAHSYCRSRKMELAPIFTENDNYLFQMDLDVIQEDNVWIGGFKNANGWKWSNGKEMGFRNWSEEAG